MYIYIHIHTFTTTPMSAISLAKLDMPPGLSDTVAENRMSRMSAARPRSMTRPSVVVSMFPPQRGTTTFLPRNLPNNGPPGRMAATML